MSGFVGVSAATLYYNPGVLDVAQTGRAAESEVRDYALEVVPADLTLGEGNVWHAWTFNGSVPGPTLTANVGDTIRVTVHNRHNLTHSFHTHLSPYPLESDGSQLNTIMQKGWMAMIPPGESYTYTFQANIPGLFYYHCHSADWKSISQHMAQGLYGAIIVKGLEELPVRDEVVIMSERGYNATSGTPYFLMNGMGLPGGEKALEEIFHHEGIAGVAAQFGKTLPVIHAKVGEAIRLNVINIGDQVHTFHLHAMTAYSADTNPGRPVPAQVSGLTPGEVDRLIVTPTHAGIWLFHCHVVNHADAGMIGVMVIET